MSTATSGASAATAVQHASVVAHAASQRLLVVRLIFVFGCFALVRCGGFFFGRRIQRINLLTRQEVHVPVRGLAQLFLITQNHELLANAFCCHVLSPVSDDRMRRDAAPSLASGSGGRKTLA